MKSGIFIWLLVMSTLPAYAGVLVIRETDTAIIIEYTGDPKGEKGRNLEELPQFRELSKVVGRTPTVADDLEKKSKATKWKDYSADMMHKAEAEAKARKAGRTSSERYD